MTIISAAAAAHHTLLIVADELFIKPANWLSGMSPEVREGLLPSIILRRVGGICFLMTKTVETRQDRSNSGRFSDAGG